MQSDIKRAIEVLNEGGIVLYPTDTIWGIGCDATNPNAVEKVYQLKQRKDSKSMLVLLDSDFRLSQYVDEVPEVAYELIGVSEKSLTIIYSGAKNLAANLIAEDGSIGIRIANHDFCQALIGRFKKPIVSTSANISRSVSPSSFDEIDEVILSGVDYVVEFGQDDIRKATPSSIIKLGKAGEVQIIRE